MYVPPVVTFRTFYFATESDGRNMSKVSRRLLKTLARFDSGSVLVHLVLVVVSVTLVQGISVSHSQYYFTDSRYLSSSQYFSYHKDSLSKPGDLTTERISFLYRGHFLTASLQSYTYSHLAL
jgi:hypothetical protein